MGRKSIIPEIEARIGKPLKEYLTKLISEGKNPQEIASELGIGKSKVYEVIKDLGLKDYIKATKRQVASGGGELRKYLDDYAADKRRAGLSPKTLKKDEETWRLYLWWLEHTGRIADLIHAIRPPVGLESLNKFFDYVDTESNRFGKQFKKTLGKIAQKSYRKRMNAFVHWLQKMEIIPDQPKENPFNKMMPIKVPRRQPEDMPDEIILKALNSFGDSFEEIRNKTIFEWFLETGMRLGGVASLKISQFDWEKGIGRIVEKGNKERTIVLSAKLKGEVEKYLKLREPIAKCDSLWINAKGQALTNSGIWRMLNLLNDKFKEDIAYLAPEERFHPHLFRHIWAKHLALSEVPGFAMMVMGGWEDLKLVQHYAAAYTQEKAWSYIDKASFLSKIT